MFMLQGTRITFIFIAFVENDMNKMYIYWRKLSHIIMTLEITSDLSCRSWLPAVNFV